ncbi:HU family DNA-binding protein [Synechococcus sp. PCC 7336]|uniref:HU family DNA-binding protein n=1 Tax=Synechococcus sp. PCC 7336 TaxID=195250 RepID=UPI000380D6C7|nr:HU family DNA-binding protein [Synechococcus sp. PCC 7336]
MNRRTLARQVAEQVDGLSIRLASAAVDAACEAIAAALADNESVTLSGFGTFKTRYRNPRQTWHPRTRQPVIIPAAFVPSFVPSTELQQRVKQALLSQLPSEERGESSGESDRADGPC